MRIGERVLNILEQKGLKQSDLALHLGTKPSTVNGWKNENRNPSCEYIIPICEFLGITTDYLLTGKEPNTISLPSPSSEQNTALTSDENTLIELFRKLPDRNKYEFIGELKGYVKCLSEQNSTNKAKDAVS